MNKSRREGAYFILLCGSYSLFINSFIQYCQITDHNSQTTIHRSQFTDHNSQFTDHNSQFTDHNSQITDHNSQITDHNSQITIHNSQITIHNSQITIHRSQITIHRSQITIHRPQAIGGGGPSACRGGCWSQKFRRYRLCSPVVRRPCSSLIRGVSFLHIRLICGG